MKFNHMMLALAIATTSLSSFSKDVRPVNSKETYFIKVTQNSDKTVSFEKCEIKNENACWLIGDKSSYDANELREARTSLNSRGNYTAMAEGALVLLSGGALMAIGTAGMGTVTATGAILGTVASFGVPATITGTVNLMVDSVNPLEQWRKSELLSENLITDKIVPVQDMKSTIKLLESALKSVE